ncbi:hypothetical protein GHT06_008890 [Daphnia sinensis]|uniref:DEAD/DEAH-box helicase domain-containing protein n=1 Tax=Daphnia sinensis TaxID=1820382 RepID=A0AAD5LLX5_9CRUS|nr:hypothetical protein GHT06_008890 [Daphnia sinensis]
MGCNFESSRNSLASSPDSSMTSGRSNSTPATSPNSSWSSDRSRQQRQYHSRVTSTPGPSNSSVRSEQRQSRRTETPSPGPLNSSDRSRQSSDVELEDDLPGEPLKEQAMIWSGYAGTQLKIALTEFQIAALNAVNCYRDTVVIQAIGSGKSVCFQNPAMILEPGDYIVVVVPTISLAWEKIIFMP